MLYLVHLYHRRARRVRCKRKQALGRAVRLRCNCESRRRVVPSRFRRRRDFERRKPGKDEPISAATQHRTALPLCRDPGGPLPCNLRQTNGARDRSSRHNTLTLLTPLPLHSSAETPQPRCQMPSLPAWSFHFLQFTDQLCLQMPPR